MITYFVWRTYFLWRYLITLVLYNFPTCILKFLSVVFPTFPKIQEKPNLRVLGCFGICIGIHVLLEVVQPLLSFTVSRFKAAYRGAEDFLEMNLPSPTQKTQKKQGKKLRFQMLDLDFSFVLRQLLVFGKNSGTVQKHSNTSVPRQASPFRVSCKTSLMLKDEKDAILRVARSH